MDDSFTTEVRVRYSDLDTYGHVNNAVYATYLEEARIAYLKEAIDEDPESFPGVVAGIELSFERPVARRGPLTVAVETTAIGETSVTMAYEVRDGGDVAATAETTIVSVGDDGRPSPIPEEFRERLVGYEGLEG